ncbi:MAG: hypothetical protein RSF40_01600 [Oscillospiraceae bacterium]
MKVNLLEDKLAVWIVCEAIKGEHHIIDKFDNTNCGDHEILFSVDGVELNFINVINRIDEIFDQSVNKRAGKMYLERYDRRSDEITNELDNIAERLREIRSTRFPEIDWGQVDK